jgi:hypothetical protein
VTIKQIIVAATVGATALGMMVHRISRSDWKVRLFKSPQIAARPMRSSDRPASYRKTTSRRKGAETDLASRRLFE